MAGFYGVYHGPQGLKKIALKINGLTEKLYRALKQFKDIKILNHSFFDTLSLKLSSKQLASKVYTAFQKEQINLRFANDSQLSITLSEITTEKDIEQIENILKTTLPAASFLNKKSLQGIPKDCLRASAYLKHPVFNSCHTETELLRYIHRLQNKELSLAHSMISPRSCTMKLNAVTELSPVSWPAFQTFTLLPPAKQSEGYIELIKELEDQLCEITGFKAFSFQPNAGSQGEYAGLLAIKKYHESKKESHRDICLIPSSAHGTNPASAVMAGLKAVSLACTKEGLIDKQDLNDKLKKHGQNLAGLMITYPSTYGFF